MRLLKLTVAALAAALMAVPATVSAAGELTIGLKSEPSSIDPHFHNLGPNNALARVIFDRLIMPDEKQRLRPGLAVSWKPIDDTTWEFKLREGVKFHDGSPFTADDVVFTFQRAPNVEGSPSSFGTYLKGKEITRIDDYTVHIKTERPYPLMPNDMSTFSIVSRKHGEGAKTPDYNSGKATVGTGAYKFVEYLPGDRIVLERNENYWGDKPEWTKVTLKTIKSGPSRVAALLAGDVDLIEQTPTPDIERLKKDPNLTLSQGISNRVIYLHLDHDRDVSPFVEAKDGSEIANPLKDQRVRMAISQAINRDAIVSRVMEGIAIKAGQLLPEGFFGRSPNLKPVKYDPGLAKRNLSEAGVGDGFKLTIHGPNDRYINDAKIAEAVAQMLTKVGIQTDVVTMPKSVYFKRASRGGPNGTPEFSFILVGWGSGTGEASSPLKSLIHTYDKSRGFGASNRGRYSNEKVDKLIEDALATVDDAKRQDLLAEATEIAINDGAIIPLHYQVNTWAARKGIKYRARTDEATVATDVFSE
ncbi:MAG: ABC transporter substrate-binding protein [Gammaproteobacteria bacterium]|nr:MAG: ABC transporter substrate-binding protein [Gammaproteobacteria bacterium]